MEKEIQTVDAYITQFPEDIQDRMQQIRAVILRHAPDAKEKISWGMPTFYTSENVIHFAGNKKHIGIYPSTEPIVFFEEQLKEYKTSKGAIQLPNNKPLPLDLIGDIVDHRLEMIIPKK